MPLLELPNDILISILQELELPGLSILSRTCKALEALVSYINSSLPASSHCEASSRLIISVGQIIAADIHDLLIVLPLHRLYGPPNSMFVMTRWPTVHGSAPGAEQTSSHDPLLVLGKESYNLYSPSMIPGSS